MATALLAACFETETSDETLAPLPLPAVTTTAVPPTAPAAPVTAGAPVTAAGPTTTLAEQPVGEWDGAAFDIGRIIDTDMIDDLYVAIDFDRYTYLDPAIGPVDAAGLRSEPAPYWWADPPFENNNPSTREFVLAPNVELVRLSPAGDDAACTDPPPVPLPTPIWEGVDISFLDTNAARQSYAILTYAPTGAVTRVRFTHGC